MDLCVDMGKALLGPPRNTWSGDCKTPNSCIMWTREIRVIVNRLTSFVPRG